MKITLETVQKMLDVVAQADGGENEPAWTNIVTKMEDANLTPMGQMSVLLACFQYQMLTGLTPGLIKYIPGEKKDEDQDGRSSAASQGTQREGRPA